MADLDPITRAENIIAGNDLTPITRLERFLAGDDSLAPITQLLSPNERKAAERADRIERIMCGIVTALFFAAVWIVEVLA